MSASGTKDHSLVLFLTKLMNGLLFLYAFVRKKKRKRWPLKGVVAYFIWINPVCSSIKICMNFTIL